MDLCRELPFADWDEEDEYPPPAPFSHHVSRRDEYVGRQNCYAKLERSKQIGVSHGPVIPHTTLMDMLLRSKTKFNAAFIKSVLVYHLECFFTHHTYYLLQNICIHGCQNFITLGKRTCCLTIENMLQWSWRFDQGRIFHPHPVAYNTNGYGYNKSYLKRLYQFTQYIDHLVINIQAIKNPIRTIYVILKEFDFYMNYLKHFEYYTRQIHEGMYNKLWDRFVFHMCTIAYWMCNQVHTSS